VVRSASPAVVSRVLGLRFVRSTPRPGGGRYVGFEVSRWRGPTEVQQHFADEDRAWDPIEVQPYLELYAAELAPYYRVELDMDRMRLIVENRS
jgi:hypothetical protein